MKHGENRMAVMKKTRKIVGIWVVIIGFIISFSQPNAVFAAQASDSREVVRVGFFAFDGYHMVDEAGNRSGYGYDFLRLAARYINFDFEYIGYDKSWDEMQEMLKDGE